jgi:glutamate/tyrosine decarboxylase-like PLP-dependent enzyme
MHHTSPDRENYEELLERLKTFFPVPVSDPVMDGYFVHTISAFLTQIDELKSAVPILGYGQPRDAGYDPGAATFPEQMDTLEAVTRKLTAFLKGMPIWAHPNSQVNVVPPTTVSSIMAFIAATIYNPNIIWDEYSARFADAEIQAVAMLADLVGYDPRQAGGLFTFGGTGTILYGCKLGLE